MVSLGAKTAQGLTYTAMARRAQAPLRLFIAVVLAISFHAQLDVVWLWGWLAAYVMAQGLEIWALWAFRPEAPTPATSSLRAALAIGSIFLLAAVFGAIAVPLWLVPGSLGPAGSVLLLAGSILNVLSLSRGSPLAFMAGAIPYAAYLMSAPLIDRAIRGSDPFSGPFILAELLFLVAAVLVYCAAERLADAQNRANAELDARASGAEAEVEAKSVFAAMVSHELRTPLGGILAAAGEIQRRAVEPEIRDRAALISQAGRMMRALLDDLLDLSKLEAKRMRVEEIAFDLPLLIEDVGLFWSSEAHRKGLTLSLEGAEALPHRAEGDPMRLRQVLNNLLSNAVKFTETGGVRIEAASHEAGGRLVLKVRVRDTGAGMSPGQMNRIFQPFDQGDDSIARKHGGTGLGLTISREFARLMGGDLTVESTAGEGACFTLVASLGRVSAEPFEGMPAPPETSASVAARILAVDDHEIGRRALSLLLGPLGCDVTPAESGPRALDLLATEVFDLVLMDVTMAGMDGLEVCRRLRGGAGPNAAAPVLAVTGHTDPAHVEACLTAGMNGWVAKPVDAQDLYEAIEKALTGRELGQAAA